MDYSYLFKENIGVDKYGFTGSSWVQDSNIINLYKNYPLGFRTKLWEFKELKELKIDDVNILTDVDLQNSKFDQGYYILDSGSGLPTEVTRHFNFGRRITLNLNKETKVWEYLNGENYVGFVGRVSKMSISNENNETQVVFPYYDGITPIVLIFYKGYDSFFLIYVQPPSRISLRQEKKEPIDTITKDVLNYFNLE